MIRDEYEPLLKKISKAAQVWLITDTNFGFVSYKTKNIVDRVPVKNKDTRISFILQGGFAEASQLKCGEDFLRTLPEYLGTSYGGTLIKGDNFGIRVAGKEDVKKLTSPYRKLGTAFVMENGFLPDTVKQFAGPEFFTFYTRVMLQIVFMTIAKKRYSEVAKQWGCKVPIDYKPWT